MKPIYKSKTMWFGGLFVANALAQTFGFGDFVPSGELSVTTSFAIGVVIWILRYITVKSVK